MIWRVIGIILALVVLLIVGSALYVGGRAFWHGFTHAPPPPFAVSSAPIVSSGPSVLANPSAGPPVLSEAVPAISASSAPDQVPSCATATAFADAAALNVASLTTASWSVFGRAETGWEIYAPLIAHEIGTACGPDQPGFAKALADWRGRNGGPADGVMTADLLKALDILWLRRRPFVAANAHGACPAPPPPGRLAAATPEEGYLTKPIQLRDTALAAYRRMAAAAREDLPSMAGDRHLLTIFSGYRDPADDAIKCASDGNCGTIAKANCSAHRTGLAMDLFLGAAPGFPPESSADQNRLFQSRSQVYRWLVANAARFGFAPYPFEPWHWEWTGEAP